MLDGKNVPVVGKRAWLELGDDGMPVNDWKVGVLIIWQVYSCFIMFISLDYAEYEFELFLSLSIPGLNRNEVMSVSRIFSKINNKIINY